MPSALPIDPRPRKFLIVDDHAGFRRTLRAFLPAGVVVECADGSEALGCYGAERPDWVFMDVEMPGLDGLAATRQIQACYPNARVIFVSRHADEEMRSTVRRLGARGFVDKERLFELRPLLAALEPVQNTSTPPL